MTAPTVAEQSADWLKLRRNRAAKLDRDLVGRALAIEWFAAMRLDEVRPKHAIKLIREIQALGLAPKTITNTVCALRVLWRDAVIEELVPSNPWLVVPRGMVKRGYKRTQPYGAHEVAQLLQLRQATIHSALVHLALYSGMRPGEVAGRRWRDWDEACAPLGALHVHSQYQDLPLKTDDDDNTRPRMLPVHPKLAAALKAWREIGWRETYGIEPTADDFIIPSRNDLTRALTKSGAYQLWRQACTIAGIKGREFRATRNTFVTFARRSSQRTDVIEAITHNSAATMIDRYCIWAWAPRCDVVNALSFEVRADERAPVPRAYATAASRGRGEQALNRGLRAPRRAPTRHVVEPPPELRARVDAMIRAKGVGRAASELGIARLATALLALGVGSNAETIKRASGAFETRTE